MSLRSTSHMDFSEDSLDEDIRHREIEECKNINGKKIATNEGNNTK